MVEFGPVRFRMTPTAAVVIGILLILLTASGCKTKVAKPADASMGTPSNQTTDQDADALSTRIAIDGDPADPPAVEQTVQAPAPKLANGTARQPKKQPTGVVWTTHSPQTHSAWAPTTATTESVPRPAPEPASPPQPDAEKPARRAEQGVGQTKSEQGQEQPNHIKPQPKADESHTDAPPENKNTSIDRKPITETDRDLDLAPEPAFEPGPSRLPMFFVFGEVKHPGPYKYTGRNRVFDMIAQVQPNRRADPSRVLLIRPSLPEDQRVMTIDADRMVRQGDMTQNHMLEPGDILYVPFSSAADIGRAIGRLFKPAPDAFDPLDD